MIALQAVELQIAVTISRWLGVVLWVEQESSVRVVLWTRVRVDGF